METSGDSDEHSFTAFSGTKRLATGQLETMLRRVKEHVDGGGDPVVIFEDQTGTQRDFDFSGSLEEVVARAAPPTKSVGPGRPKLGVVCREVSLLPRHWEWLEQQPHGISAALRRLVDQARKHEPGKERARRIIEAASKVMWVLAGNLEGFEEASRALFARNQTAFESLVSAWPEDVRAYLVRRVAEAVQLENGEDRPL